MELRSLYFVLFIFIISCQQNDNAYDLVITNAFVFDGLNYYETEQTLFVRGNKIAGIEPTETFSPEAYEIKELIDANGRFVMPGLIEGHGHYLSYGEGLSQLQLDSYDTWNDIVDAVADRAKELPAGTWIEGRGWHQEKWTETPNQSVQGYPSHFDLSNRVPDHPVYLTHASGHAAFANQAAMNAVGLSSETVAPSGGRILKDEKKRNIGVFEENATGVFENYIRETKKLEEVWEQASSRAASSCLENGITSFQDAGSSVNQIKWFHNKAKAGKLPVRLYLMAFDSLSKLKNNFPEIRYVNEGDTFLTVRAVKAYFDGALGSRGAWLLEDYADQEGYFGQNTMEVTDLQQYAEVCTKHNLQFCVHAIGDKANRKTLDLFETNAKFQDDHRWRIEHAQHIDPKDQPRFSELGVIASMQPIHCTSDAPFVGARLGEKRAQEGAYVWRNLLDFKTDLAIGTDVPVESINPFENMYAAITRKRSVDGEAFFSEQNLTRLETLQGYTAANAHAAFEETFKGQLKNNYLADIIILDQNLMKCAIDDIPATKVHTTILNGKVVYTYK